MFFEFDDDYNFNDICVGVFVIISGVDLEELMEVF